MNEINKLNKSVINYNNRSEVLSAIKKDGINLYYAEKFRDDYEIVMKAVTNNGNALRYASERLRNDRNLVLLALIKDEPYLDPNTNEPIIVRNYGLQSIISRLNYDLLNDEEVILTAIKRYFMEFEFDFASEQLKLNKEFVLRAIKVNPFVIRHLSDKFVLEGNGGGGMRL